MDAAVTMDGGSAAALEDEPAAAAAQYLTFSLGDEVFAVDIRGVREIIQCGAMTSVPVMPAFVRGVINLRGAVVPVIDLNARFGRARATLGMKSCIVIFDAAHDGEHIELGLLVDAVSEVVDIPASAIEAAPAFGASVHREFIQGVCRNEGRFVTILAPEQAFDVDDMAQLCDSAQASAFA